MTKLRVVTWNIRDGGTDDGSHHRLLAQLDLLRELDMDIAAIQEAKWFDRDGNALLHLAERQLGRRGILHPSNNDGCHLVTLVRDPKIQVVREGHRSVPFWHGLNQIEVRVDGFPHRLNLVNAHLAPSAPDIRLGEAQTLKLHKHACIAMGDWNAAPADGIHIPVPDVVHPEHARTKLNRDPAQAIQAAGFIDTGAQCGDSTPTVGYHRHDRLAFRCDRIYVNLPAKTILSHRVIETGRELSDHLPVVVELDLTKNPGWL